jgi:hypothetical protein
MIEFLYFSQHSYYIDQQYQHIFSIVEEYVNYFSIALKFKVVEQQQTRQKYVLQ